MVDTLVNLSFQVRMFPAVNDSIPEFVLNWLKSKCLKRKATLKPNYTYYIMLDLPQEKLEEFAEKQQYELKLLESDLKITYDSRQKKLFEPFRTKDINEIYLSEIEKALNISEYQRKKTLIRYQFIHDMNEWSDIEEKFRETTINGFLSQNYYDGDYQEYHALTAIKNYLGERWGFQYAFMYFYTSWLITPAVGGFICFLWQIKTSESINLMSFSFSILITFWMTYF